jgi:uncharacterized membrane protein
MTDSSPPKQGHEPQGRQPIQFILHPYRSLSARGFLILMTVLSAVSFVAGLAFCLIGAWPVMGFFGLDVALVYWAFKSNYRSGRAYEVIDLTPDLLTLTRVAADGAQEKIDINPYWARVSLSTDHPDGRTSLRIIAQGRELRLGQFLNDDERREFSEALHDALLSTRSAAHA